MRKSSKPWDIRRSAGLLTLALVLVPVVAIAGSGVQGGRTNSANWPLADKYSADKLRHHIYSSSVTPTWLRNEDRFWYLWRDSSGPKFYIVDCDARKKDLLFDSSEMAAKLSEVLKKPYDAQTLPITTIAFEDDNKSFTFRVGDQSLRYILATKELYKIAPPRPQGAAATGQGRGGGQGAAQAQGQQQGFRNFSPDRKSYVYAEDHNLFYVEVVDGKDSDPIQLTKDGAQYYSFGAASGAQQQQREEQEQQEEQEEGQERAGRRVRANVTWSSDSKMFYVTRMDTRDVKELWLVNSLSEPRPTLLTYKYAMPGEEGFGVQEMWLFYRDSKEFKRANVDKYKHQRSFDVAWNEQSKYIRLVRRDRLQRNLEFIELDTATNEATVLIAESVIDAFLERQPPRYIGRNRDILWWSERTGWGHFYLYDNKGELKHAVTSGPWRADSFVQVDAEKGHLYFTGVGREEGENPYFRHLYRINLDGTGLTLLDEGDADHTSTLSPSRRYIVDNFSRVDLAPRTVVRDHNGNIILELKDMDLSRLLETGWKMPERFIVKAADGVTDIHGNIWKPFDFDPNKKYPVILHVYPGPQTESVAPTFSATATNQHLAQLGFIVVQIGNRGGNPRRSNAYHSFGYYNLRDYGLADKKRGIEELATRHTWIDINRVGIYGHSGGGFMTAAALLVPPYNEFFKVGVSSAGNHDNNVYNANWSEQHHGLKEVEYFDKDGKKQTRFEIKVPANHEVAANLKGHLLLVHGDMDNNVHPAGTIRLVNALIRANKRFDFMLLPGQAHGFGNMTGYFNQLMYEYFSEHLLGDYYRGKADINEKK
jgi:dipeptidyl aminopeptidase/acylaminoacyl peptidase